MEAELTKDGIICTLKVTGEINIQTNQQFEKEVRSALNEKPKKLIFDFTNLDLISSTGIRTIIQAGKEAKKVDRRLEFIVSKQGTVKEIFYATGIYSIFTITYTDKKKS